MMKDPRMLKMMKSAPMPFDGKRTRYGGFKSISKPDALMRCVRVAMNFKRS